MCEKEGTPCEKVEGIGGVTEGACELLTVAIEARLHVRSFPIMGMLECAKKPRIEVSPQHKDFGIMEPLGLVAKQQVITITSVGDDDLVIHSVRLHPQGTEDFELVSDLDGVTIPPREQRTFLCTCLPSSAGDKRATVQIESNAVNVGGPVSVTLVVIAGYPEIDVTPPRHDFGRIVVGQPSTPVTFVITNPGVDWLDVQSAGMSGEEEGFEISKGDPIGRLQCRASDPKAEVQFEMTYTPVAVGKRTAVLRIDSDAHGGPVIVVLEAEGVAPEIAVDRREWDFERILLEGKPKKQTFHVTNPGSAPLHITKIELVDSEGFTITAGGKPTEPLQPSSESGAELVIEVTSLPTVVGEHEARLVIHSDAVNESEPVAVALTAEGVQPEIAIDHRSFDFEEVLVDGEPKRQTFRVTNPGGATLHITKIEIPKPQDFTIVAGGESVDLAPLRDDPEAEVLIEVECQTTALGPRRARLIVRSDAANEAKPIVVELTAKGVQPEIAVDRKNKNFGKLLQGTSDTETFTITNPGSAPLRVTGIEVEPATHFSITSREGFDDPIDPLSQDGNAKGTFTITCTPNATGSQQATVTIESDAPSGPLAVTLRVLGVVPTVRIAEPHGAVVHDAVNPNQARLTAQGAPGGGRYTWTIQSTAIANYVGGGDPGDVAAVDLQGVAPGTTQVSVTYTIGTLTSAPATVPFHVVHVAITQGATLDLLHPNVGNQQSVLNAVGTPVSGTPSWQPLQHNGPQALGYHGSRNGLNVTVKTQHRGRSTAEVRYTLAGVTASASIDVDVWTMRCSEITWAPPGNNVVAVPHDFCAHEGTNQHPMAVTPTAGPFHPHHHGDACRYCQQAGRRIHHHIHPDTGATPSMP
ncbi:Hypothetical protein A7982_06382 [Minicystis rosea]|nr:Hypothetical protein A7982_06382 [Minicystis rosea]